MDNITQKFIDNLIREYAHCDDEGYHLNVDNDSVRDAMQKLINERIDLVYAEDQYDSGLIPHIDSVNGEVTWRAP